MEGFELVFWGVDHTRNQLMTAGFNRLSGSLAELVDNVRSGMLGG